MTHTNIFTRSISTAALTGALLIAPIAAMAQAPYTAPTPDQYAAQNPQYTAPADQSSPDQNYDPNNGQYGAPQDPNGSQQDQYDPQQGMPQNAPQGIEQAPPAIPDYSQPPAPGDGYIWTPGYWAWTGEGYEWINGAWVMAPYTGALWTPGYWGDGDDGYYWNAGYWGPVVGYYGGLNYGFGYFGIGFYGGYWGGGRFFYNRTYCNLGYGGRGFHTYDRAYNGFSGHPSGSSFVRGNFARAGGSTGYRGGAAFAANRGSAINGNSRASSFGEGNHSIAANTASRSYGGASNYRGASRSYAGPSTYSGASNYSGASRSYAQPAAQSHASYSGGGGNYGGGAHAAAPAGSGGGGGGSHGGGGGGHR
jgi:hypothetical protein